MYAEQICAKMREEKIPVVYTVHTHAHTVLYIYEGRKKRSFLASLVDIIAINQITGYSGNFLLLFCCAVVVVVCASVQCTIWRVLKPQVLVNIQLPCVYVLPECVCVFSSIHQHICIERMFTKTAIIRRNIVQREQAKESLDVVIVCGSHFYLPYKLCRSVVLLSLLLLPLFLYSAQFFFFN